MAFDAKNIAAPPKDGPLLHFKKGEVVTAGRRSGIDKGMIWTTASDNASGWVPEKYLQLFGSMGVAQEDYFAPA